MRTVFLGTSHFAAAVLAALADSPHRPRLVITRPDRPRGRGRQLGSPPVADAARALSLALQQPASVNTPEAGAAIAAVDPQVLVVCAFGALIKEPLLSDQQLLNVHPSLLPRWRGAAPIERSIMAGDRDTGVCIMRLTAGLDSGPVCLRQREPIAAQDTYGTLAERLQPIAGELLLRALDLAASGDLVFHEQDERGATYAEKIAPADRLLDPTRSVVELERTVRALHPHVGARLALADDTHLGVLQAIVDQSAAGPPGALRGRDGALLWGAGDGALRLLRVQPQGGRPMDAAAYLRGHDIQDG